MNRKLCSFLKGSNKPSKQELTPNYIAAKTLCAALRKTNKIWKNPNLDKWAREIRLLKIECSISDAQLTKVLDWYVQNIRNKYIPHIYSASGLREKFNRLQEAFFRDHPEEMPCMQKPDPRAIKIYEELSSAGWPLLQRNSILAVITQSLINYDAWLKRLQDLSRLTHLIERLEMFRCHLLNTLPPSETAITNWLRSLWSRKENRWEYDVMNDVWNEYHPQWNAESLRRSWMWCGSTDLWYALMEKLNANTDD